MTTLYKYYDEICGRSKNVVGKVWEKKHYLHIAETSADITAKELAIFLRDAVEIARAGWGDDRIINMSFDNWKFKDLRNVLTLKWDFFSKESVTLVVKAMSKGFTFKDYENFLNVTNVYEGFGKFDCRESIFDAAFGRNVNVKEILHPTNVCRFERNEELWTKLPKSTFNLHLKWLLEMFDKTAHKVIMKFS